MTTRLGPATINVSLNVAQALKELDVIEKRIKEMGQTKVREDERDNRQQTEMEQEARKIEEVAQRIENKARSGRFGSTAIKLAAGWASIKAAETSFQFMLPTLGQGIESSFKGTLAEEIGKVVNERFQALSNSVSDLFAKVQAILPSIDETKQVTRARLLLGQNPTLQGTGELYSLFYQVNEAFSRLDRQKDKIFPEMIGQFIGRKTQEAFSGGKVR